MSLNAKYQDPDYEYEEYEAYEEENEHTLRISPTLITCANWFIRIGLVIAAILLVYFIVIGNVFTAFMFVVGLIVAYLFGYFCMFCLDKLFAMND